MCVYLHSHYGNNAKVAQLVEHDLAKVGVASSSLVFRSACLDLLLVAWRFFLSCPNGEIGRHEGLKILWPLRPCRFDSGFGY